MASSLRIAHLLASNFFGGPEKQLVEHARRLARHNITAQILSFEEAGKDNQLLRRAGEAGIATREIPARGRFNPETIQSVTQHLRSEGIDLLCVHGYKANVVGRIASWRAGIPLVAISRGWTGESFAVRCYEWLDRLFLRLADQVIAVSEGQKEKILRVGVPTRRVAVIHNAIELADLSGQKRQDVRQQLGFPGDALLVASAGRLSPEKNYGTMIEVAARVAKLSETARFVIFGDGALRSELQEKINSSGLQDRFLLPGFRNDLQDVLHEIDIFMLPSFTEGLPNVVLEAFAAGKPVVATRVGGTPEVVQDGISGFLARPDEAALMAEQLLLLLGEPALRRRMGAAGHDKVRSEFGFAKQTRLYEELYLRVAK